MTDTPLIFDDGAGAHSTRWGWYTPDLGAPEIAALPGQGNPNVGISRDDPCWDRILQAARRQYGDPNIHYYHDPTDGKRSLAFGDNTKLPSDGTLVYRDHGHNWLVYPNGRYAPADNNFAPTAPAFAPAGYVLKDGHYCPINSHGEQIGAQQSDLPRPTGWHTNNNMWTPTNKNGDYYEITDPATGARKYFDKDGHPITQQQYDNATPTPDTPPAGPTNPDTVLTGEQNSGAAAAAAKKLEAKLEDRNDKSLEADRQLAEVLLNAHATTAKGAAVLNQIQRDVEDAINNNPKLDTPAGKQEFQRFINGKLAEIMKELDNASLDVQSHTATTAAIADVIGNRPSLPETQTPTTTPSTQTPATAAPAGDGGAVTAAPSDLLGGDPTGDGGDLLGGGGPLGGALGAATNPLMSALGGLSGLPGMAAGLPGSLGSGLGSGMGGLGGLGTPAGNLLDHGHSRHKGDHDDDGDDADLSDAFGDSTLQPPAGSNGHHDEPSHDPPITTPGAPTLTTPGAATPLGATTPAPPATGPTTITLADGTPLTVDNPELAGVLKDIQAGTPPADAFRNHKFVLPPTTTPPTTPLAPGQLHPGAYATYSNGDIAVAFGPDKAWVDGKLQPISAAAKPGFLAWQNPPAPTAATPTPVPSPPLPTPAPTPAATAAALVPAR